MSSDSVRVFGAIQSQHCGFGNPFHEGVCLVAMPDRLPVWFPACVSEGGEARPIGDLGEGSGIDFSMRTSSAPRIEIPRLTPVTNRATAKGKFVFEGDRKLYLRGVTYGPFRPNGNGCEYGSREAVVRDFGQIVANGFNAVRTYTVPPRWFLDLAAESGIRLMVGVPWQQHITFLDSRATRREIEGTVREAAATLSGHPAVLSIAVGNEIPAPIVRWHGRRRVERFLGRLESEVRGQDSEVLVTYVNYPTTEYLRLPFCDLFSFNVYLEAPDRLEAYLKRLQTLADEKPLLLAEVGLDSRRNGLEGQAASLRWQVRKTFENGAAGAFLFSWTDEWHRGGHEIDDWDFGLTTRSRAPKLALNAVAEVMEDLPVRFERALPRISVAVCAYNADSTIRECLEGIQRLNYPNFETVVVDDGSFDRTAEIASEFPVRLITTENRGLSSARNTALVEADGEIIAYIDSDAYPDPEWLTYLARDFLNSDHVGIGGPNLQPPGVGIVEESVSHSPGGPVHVLLTDDLAEHIPGCNMAFRRRALLNIGGFDTQFRIAGDDVDVCWRLQEAGGTLGFSAPAVVWHHRRDTVKAYWRQQLNYGRAEAMLERKWPEKYNHLGHPTWGGSIYGNGHTLPRAFRWRVYHGVWGSSLFQRLYTPPATTLDHLPEMPEWWLVVAGLGLLSLLGFAWTPFFLLAPLFLAAGGLMLIRAVLAAAESTTSARPLEWRCMKGRLLTTFLHLAQPLARLLGRIDENLTPWRRRGADGFLFPRPRSFSLWSEYWRSLTDWVGAFDRQLRLRRTSVAAGSESDRWDLEVRCGLLASVRSLVAIEEHGEGKQMIRLRVWPKFYTATLLLASLLTAFAALAVLDGAWTVATILGVLLGLFVTRALFEASIAMRSVQAVVNELADAERS